MHVWLMTVGEPLPTDPGAQRLHRAGVLASSLRAQGHEVTWWTSTFDHYRKEQRWPHDHTALLDEHYQLQVVYSSGYKKNISIQRINDHRVHARRVKQRITAETNRPDVILCSLPTLELCRVAVDYGNTHQIPVVLDVRDLWPDIFLDAFPSWAQWAVRPALLPMFNTVKYACARATAITGITSAFVNWGVAYAQRARTHLDKEFPLGYSAQPQPKETMIAAREFWRTIGVDTPVALRVCFFGNLSKTMAEEMFALIEAAKQLHVQGDNIQFVICGSGENLEVYKKAAQGYDNIVFPGWMDAPRIRALMEISSVGLLPYISRIDFMNAIPNKVAEYLSAGLPIVSSIKGVAEALLAENNCGVTYQNADVPSLVQTLRTLACDTARLQTMARNAETLFRQRFDAQRVYNDMGIYLQQIASIPQAER